MEEKAYWFFFGGNYMDKLSYIGSIYKVELNFTEIRKPNFHTIVTTHVQGKDDIVQKFWEDVVNPLNNIKPQKLTGKNIGNRRFIFSVRLGFEIFRLKRFHLSTSPLTKAKDNYVFESGEIIEPSKQKFITFSAKHDFQVFYGLKTMERNIVNKLYFTLMDYVKEKRINFKKLRFKVVTGLYFFAKSNRYRGKFRTLTDMKSISKELMKRGGKGFSINFHPTAPSNSYFGKDQEVEFLGSRYDRGFFSVKDTAKFSQSGIRFFVDFVIEGGSIVPKKIYYDKKKICVLDFVSTFEKMSKRLNIDKEVSMEEKEVPKSFLEFIENVKFNEENIGLEFPESQRFIVLFTRLKKSCSRLVDGVRFECRVAKQSDGINRYEYSFYLCDEDREELNEKYENFSVFEKMMNKLLDVSEKVRSTLNSRKFETIENRENSNLRNVRESYSEYKKKKHNNRRYGNQRNQRCKNNMVKDVIFGIYKTLEHWFHMKENFSDLKTRVNVEFQASVLFLTLEFVDFDFSCVFSFPLSSDMKVVVVDGWVIFELVEIMKMKMVYASRRREKFIRENIYRRIEKASFCRYIGFNVHFSFFKKCRIFFKDFQFVKRTRMKISEVKKNRESKNKNYELYEKLNLNKKFEIRGLMSCGKYVFEDLSIKMLQSIKNIGVIELILIFSDLKMTLPDSHDLELEFNRLMKIVSGRKIKKRDVYDNSAISFVKHIKITPLQVICCGHNLQRSNSLIREVEKRFPHYYVDGTTPFAIVEFLQFNHGGTFIEEVLKDRLRNSFEVMGKKYEFIGASGNGLKEHKAWFIEKSPNIGFEEIIEIVGNLQKIKTPAKFLSRLSLAFTGTVPSISLRKNEFVVVKDLRRNNLEFTEGCGVISPNAALEICKVLKLQNNNSEFPVISAFQIRYCGFKGVLVVDKNWKFGSEIKVAFSESQKKFESRRSIVLDIVNVSKLHPNLTNKQVLLLLSNLGIENHVFVDLCQDVLRNIDSKNPKLIQKYGGVIRDYNIGAIYELNNEIVNDDYFLSHLFVKFSRNMIQEMYIHQRIPIKNGAILIGVFDVSGTLKENEVFIRISNGGGGLSEIFEGDVLVSRSPGYHPTDVQILKAVKSEALEYLSNVIVFSTHGNIPQFLKTAGGDLDGDLYWIMKVSEEMKQQLKKKMSINQDDEIMKIINEKKKSSQSMKILEENVRKSDLVDFYVDHFYNENIGILSTLHLMLCDKLGVEDPRTISVANLCKASVDFSSTGVRVKMEENFQSNIRKEIEVIPHYFIDKIKKKYRSMSILGEIHTFLTDYVLEPLVQGVYKGKTTSSRSYRKKANKNEENHELNKKLLVDGYLEYVRDIEPLYLIYRTAVQKVMKKFRISNELEFFAQNKIMRNSDYSQFEDVVSAIRDIFDEIGSEKSKNKMEVFKKLSCAYYVCYSSHNLKSSKRNYCFVFSFPWIIGGGVNWSKFFLHMNKTNIEREEIEGEEDR